MNTNDPFEQKLRCQPRRKIPPEWRAEILAAARRSANEPFAPGAAQSHSSFGAACRSLLAQWLWPHPKAWAGLAAVWLLILGLNLAASDSDGPAVARQAALPSRQLRELLRQQEQLFAELIGPIDQSPASEPKRALPRPRSQRRDDFLNA
jgi:hypothetical protein